MVRSEIDRTDSALVDREYYFGSKASVKCVAAFLDVHSPGVGPVYAKTQ
jgi:hypothetical protein